MKVRPTNSSTRVTERQKALARLILLAVVGLFCPPLAAARSGGVWMLYLILVVLYSLWTVALTRRFSQDRRIGYLLCVTDGAVLIPLMVWSAGVAMRAALGILWVAGLATSLVADELFKRQRGPEAHARGHATSAWDQAVESRVPATIDLAPLERALRVRLRILETSGTRFGLVLLRMTWQDEMSPHHGAEETRRLVDGVGRAGLALLGPDAQVFALPGGRLAFAFATEDSTETELHRLLGPAGRVDPYDVESIAMALARKACEQTVGGRPVECVVGWASAPADGMDPDDLLYAAESGVRSAAAFRRVGGSRVPVPEAEKKRAAAS